MPTWSGAETAYEEEQVLPETLTMLIHDSSLIPVGSCGREKYMYNNLYCFADPQFLVCDTDIRS